MKSIKLYTADKPFWLTDASINDGGDLVITSGDANNEWSKIVPAGHKRALLNVLLESVAIDEGLGDEADGRLLGALSAMFAGEKNPYEDIGAFLERHAIPARDSNWLWGGD
jgi:hypothetical protein